MIEAKATSRAVRKYGNRGAWQAEADHLRAHPGDTFVIERRPYPDKAMYALAAHVRSGGYVAFRPAGAFDGWVERAGDQLEVIAVYTGPAEGTQAQEAGQTVAPTPPGVDPADSDGEADSAIAFRARLEALPPEGRADAVVAWVGAMPLERRKAVISAWVSDYLAETGESVYDLLDELRVRLGETAQDSGGKADDEVDLYALSEDELRSHLESLATPELHKIMESLGMSPFFANRIDAIGVIETKIHNPKAVADEPTPVPGTTPDSDGSEVVWMLVGGTKRNPVHAATILGQDVLHQKGYLWMADGEAAKMTIRPASFEDVRQNAVAYVENFLARKAGSGQDSGINEDSAAVDPTPARKQRTVARRAS